MITTPADLVLGAGASYPYGFPTARGLKELICEQFSSTRARASQFLSCLNPGGSKYAPEEFSKSTRGLFGIEIQDAQNRLAEALDGDIHLRHQVNFEDNLDILREHMFLGCPGRPGR